MIGAAAALAAIAGWLAMRPARDASSATRTTNATAAAARVGSRLPATRIAAATATPVLDDPMPVIDATHDAVHAVGKRCWTERTPRPVAPGRPDDTVGRMELRLHVVVAGGLARVDHSEVIATRRLTDELRDCILAGVAATTWPVASGDGRVEIIGLFRMGDYTVPTGAG